MDKLKDKKTLTVVIVAVVVVVICLLCTICGGVGVYVLNLRQGIGLSGPVSSTSNGLDIPISNGKWEVTITNAREENQLFNSDGTRYTPNSGYTFVIIDTTFQNLDPSQETKISADTIAVIDNTGEIFKNIGSGFQNTYSIGGLNTYSNDQSNTMKFNLVFSVKKANINDVFKFQFMDLPLIPFSVKVK